MKWLPGEPKAALAHLSKLVQVFRGLFIFSEVQMSSWTGGVAVAVRASNGTPGRKSRMSPR